MFNTVVDVIMRVAFVDQQCVQYNIVRFITNLMFANESTVFTNTKRHALQHHLNHVIIWIKDQHGQSPDSSVHIYLNKAQIVKVCEFKKLGSLVQQKKDGTIGQAYS